MKCAHKAVKEEEENSTMEDKTHEYTLKYCMLNLLLRVLVLHVAHTSRENTRKRALAGRC